MRYAKLIKALLLFYVIGNALAAAVMYLLKETAYIREVLVRTGISVGLAVFMLLVIGALESMEAKKWDAKCRDIFSGQTKYGLLRCSSGYLRLPIIVIFLDALIAYMFLREFGNDLHALVSILKEEAMQEPLFCLLLFNGISVYVTLYYCWYKVCYTESGIYAVHFLKKVKISGGEIRRVVYCRTKKEQKEKLIIETKGRKLTLRAAVLADGWNEFVNYLKDFSDRRDINFICRAE